MSISFEQVAEWRKQIEEDAKQLVENAELTDKEKQAYICGVSRGTFQMLQTLKLQCEVEFSFRF